MMINQKKNICILCSRIDAHGGVVQNIIKEHNLFNLMGIFDDNPELIGRCIDGVPVLGSIKDLPNNIPNSIDGFFISTGDNYVREKCYNILNVNNLNLVNVIHPSSLISKNVKLGIGIFVGQNVVINNSSCIGDCAIINTSASIDHDNLIGKFVNVSPGCHTSGRVIIQSNVFLGTGSIIIPDRIIGEHSIVGAGSIVISDIRPNCKVVGNPARVIKNL